tara:strand:+ start:220 stop:798 length:579 start_codon:yes stop_codon:yes gene_type:complete
MKKIIMDVLEDMSSGQVNLESEAARRTIATMITAALKEKGEYKKHTNDELEEQEARKYWVCKICGQSSYDLDWDYIGSGTNHLSCEVRLELDEKKRNGHREYPYNSFVRNKGEADKLKVQAKSPYNDGWTRQYYKEKENAKQIIDKLSEEIVSNNDTGYIYETPDGGKTVFRRDVGSDKRELVENWKELKKE